jgi:hypothetical protein
VNVPLVVAGVLILLGAGLHGIGGELFVMRRVSVQTLPPSRFGGPGATRAMIHATWHITTVGFLTVGVALLLAGSVLDGDTAHAFAVLGAAAATGFAGVVLGQSLISGLPPRFMLRHPAPIALTAAAALAWLGAL